MRVLFPNPTYNHEDSYSPDKFAADLKREANSVSAEHQLEERNLDRGADWSMYVIAFAILFASGKTFNDNIDGWIRRRISKEEDLEPGATDTDG